MSAEPRTDPPDPENRLQVRGAAGLRAMAHPARLAAMKHLMALGPATATELGDVVGLTPSAMSYHLRSLERAGFIETAPSRGDGRERVWKSNQTGWEVDMFEDGTADTRAASVELLEAVLAMQEIDTRQWLADAQVPGWLDYGSFLDKTILATQEELSELTQRIVDLLKPLDRRERRDSAPAGAIPVRTIFRGFPASDRGFPASDRGHTASDRRKTASG